MADNEKVKDISAKICTIEELMSLSIKIPDYQRPYRWEKKSAATLFSDILEAFNNRKPNYRIGSIILHEKINDRENNKLIYDVVDGQQRLTTIAIILYLLNGVPYEILNTNYGKTSIYAIRENYRYLKGIINSELSDPDRKNGFTQFVLRNCNVVQIITTNQQEAFQFFDSQNSRGKKLKPHDLLKAYHLRETDVTETEKVALVSQWEDSESDLEELFKFYLYPIKMWLKKRDGQEYDENKIDVFKGIPKSSNYNHAKFIRMSSSFLDQINSQLKILKMDELELYQLTEEFIAGKDFFKFVSYYMDIKSKVEKRLDTFCLERKMAPLPRYRIGDLYTYRLVISYLVFFVDRFNIESLSDSIIIFILKWAYIPRCNMRRVYLSTINNYVLGWHYTSNGINLFDRMTDMKKADEILIIDAPELNKENHDKRSKDIQQIVDNLWQK